MSPPSGETLTTGPSRSTHGSGSCPSRGLPRGNLVPLMPALQPAAAARSHGQARVGVADPEAALRDQCVRLDDALDEGGWAGRSSSSPDGVLLTWL